MMLRRTPGISLLVLMALLWSGCTRQNKSQNPLADLDTQQPDKVLFDRAAAALKRNKFDVARLTLQTLINTYPDSEYVARAKLTVGDTWYMEGGSAALAQAEIEYKDFITFFPNMPEAAEAQLRVGDIHYKQMEKPDRDYTHAKRAEDEYRQMILQFPDHPKVDEAKTKLRQVQEVLAEREFRIGQFYFRRESWIAAAARLKSVTDTYPLYSGADEALFMLGNAYENQIELARAQGQLTETSKGKLIQHLADQAAAAYTRIVTRYPAMYRADDAKERLEALKRPVPTPTAEAIALNKKEEEGRGKSGIKTRILSSIKRGPDVAKTTGMGEPTMTDPPQASAVDMVRTATAMVNPASSGGGGSVSAEVVGSGGAPPTSDATPRSADPPGAPGAEQPAGDPVPPQIQVNDADQGGDKTQEAGTSSSSDSKDEKKNTSSSRKKKKKGLRKVIPF